VLHRHGNDLWEISSKTSGIDYQQIARGVIKDIGYDDAKMGFDYKTCSIMVNLVGQASEIASGVHVDREELCAGDQGLMFGYATNETEELMPVSLIYTRNINLLLHKMRKHGVHRWIRPDSKTQVTVEYNDDMVPVKVHTVVVSVQHSPDVTLEYVRQVVKQAIPKDMLDDNTIYHINPAGSFVMGGRSAIRD
jgi:S-adenosylmethionine synthetase